MNENIINYLRENKEKFSKEILIQELRKTGYVEADILEGEKIVYSENVTNIVSNSSSSQTKFWDFKSKRIYLKSSEKWIDFLFGFFSPILVGIISSILFFIGSIVFIVFYFFSIFYLFNRRRFISYGIIVNFIAWILFIITAISISLMDIFSF